MHRASDNQQGYGKGMKFMKLATGIAYFVRNRRPEVAALDLQKIRDAGCTYVVHFFTEFDQVFFKDSVAEIIALTKDLGLEAYVDPWALGGFICTKYTLFPIDHPEACQRWSDGRPLMQACPNHPVFRDHVRRWLDDAVHIGGETVFWDEPHLQYRVTADGTKRWACHCDVCQKAFSERYNKAMPTEMTAEVMEFRRDTLVTFFTEMTREAKDRGLRNSLCLLPFDQPEHGFGDWNQIAALPALDVFGTDPYWYSRPVDLESHVRSFSEKTVALANRYGKEPQIWLQGFRVPAGRESEIQTAAEVAYAAGVRNLAVWVDKFGTGDNNRSANPEAVWQTTGNVFRGLHARDAADETA